MKKMLFAAAAATTMLVAAPVQAQVALDTTILKLDGAWGLQSGLGYDFNFSGVRVTPMVNLTTVYVDGDSFSQFAGRAEAGYSIPGFAEVGGGVIFREGGSALYGMATIPVAGPKVRARVQVGDGYFGGGLRVNF